MRVSFRGSVFSWRGPSPYHFIAVPERVCRDLQAVAKEVTYGWGMIPVVARIRGTSFKTSLFPKDGGYLVPVKDVVRTAEGVGVGDRVQVTLEVPTRW